MNFTDVVPFYPAWNFELFHLINQAWSNELFDVLMPLVRNKYFWLPLYVFIAAFVLLNFQKKGALVLLIVAGSFAISNTVSAEIMKPLFKLDRPCNDPVYHDHVKLRVDCGPGKSFPSAHATNHFAIALCLGILFWPFSRWVCVLGVVWALWVSYAQVYVGVHYPLDVLAGALIGSVIGAGMALSWNRGLKLKDHLNQLPAH